MRRSALLLVCSLACGGCITVKIAQDKPIEIHAVLDVKTEKALDDFFGDLDKKSAAITPTPAKP